jgi:predicted  nucleic acid-binding Zn-ribbon protein
MFVYEGRLEWSKYAQNETAIIILPSGPIRAGDIAWILSQWTVDSKGNKKALQSQRIPISQVIRTAKGDDSFSSKPGWYTWKMTSSDNYEKLNLVMSNDAGGMSEMEFKRIWKAEGEWSRECGRIWLGKINWSTFASDEFCLFIAPEGFGEGRPILSMWQWTQDSQGKEKAPSFRAEQQKILSPLDDNGVKFSYHSYYDITCTWNKKTDTLAVHMKGPEADQDLGEFKLSAVTNPHDHEWDPPLSPPQNAQLEVRLPQPEPSLPRVLEPLPFPIGLIENLRYVIAYADQAGYCAKYAHERFTKLDAEFHLRGEVINERNAALAEFRKEVKELGDDLTVEKAKVADLTTRLAEAQAAFDAELKKRDDEIKKEQGHDAEDHKTIDRLVSQLEYERASKAELQKNLDQTKTSLIEAEARLAADGANIAALTTRITALEAELEVEKKAVEKLQNDIKEKTDRIAQLEKSNADTQSKLDQALRDVKTKQDYINQKDVTIRDQNTRIDNLNRESNAKTITIINLQQQISNLQEQIRNQQQQPTYRFSGKIKCLVGNNVMVDYTLGSDVKAYEYMSAREHEIHQIWEFFTVSGRNDVVVIKNTEHKHILWSAGKHSWSWV